MQQQQLWIFKLRPKGCAFRVVSNSKIGVTSQKNNRTKTHNMDVQLNNALHCFAWHDSRHQRQVTTLFTATKTPPRAKSEHDATMDAVTGQWLRQPTNQINKFYVICVICPHWLTAGLLACNAVWVESSSNNAASNAKKIHQFAIQTTHNANIHCLIQAR